MILLLLAFLNISYARAANCVFPDKAKIVNAAPAGPGQAALVEANTRCIYLVSTGKIPAILWSKPLSSLPSDLKFHGPTGKLFFFLFDSAELASLNMNTRAFTVEAKIVPGETCYTDNAGPVSASTCTNIVNAPYQILLGGDRIVLQRGRTVLVAKLDALSEMRAIGPVSWMRLRKLELDPLSGRALVLTDQGGPVSNITWVILNQNLVFLSPLPEVSVVNSAAMNLNFFPGGSFFVGDDGLVYHTGDLKLVANLSESHLRAFFPNDVLVTIRQAEQGLYKSTLYNENLRPVAFEYFFQAPLLVAPSEADYLFYVLSEGSFSETCQSLPLRNIP